MFQSIERKHPHFYQYFRIIIVIAASILYAWNLCCFAKAANLFPGGFSGISLLLQKIGLTFFHIQIPFSLFNILHPEIIIVTISSPIVRGGVIHLSLSNFLH